AVAVAAGAEDDRDPSSAELTGRPQHLLECIRLVRIVDDHRERLALVHGLEAARNAADGFESALDRVVVDTQRARGEERTERVLDVEAAEQLQIDAVERARVIRGERDRAG